MLIVTQANVSSSLATDVLEILDAKTGDERECENKLVKNQRLT